MKPKLYHIHRTLWHMPEIVHEQEAQLLEFYALLNECNAGDKPLSEVLAAFYGKGVVPRLLGIVLKPWQPTPAHRLWNAFWAWKNKVDKTDLARGLTRSEWGEAVADFFVGSGTGMLPSMLTASNLESGASGSESQNAGKSLMNPKTPILPLLLFMTSFSSLLQTPASQTAPPSSEPVN
jgi:hypothetical protein